jgi:hypothetical protein
VEEEGRGFGKMMQDVLCKQPQSSNIFEKISTVSAENIQKRMKIDFRSPCVLGVEADLKIRKFVIDKV